ncbi:MAG: 50S ribosomal protein L9 [Verrucomicrobiales bacterium]|nr:50S ribosomal protein L9 [Verrucomicrobiae bacterium]
MATIEVILKERVQNLGAEADVVNVKAGYARNFLIPSGKAYEATKGNLRQLQNLKAVRAQREAQELAEAQSMISKLKKLKLNMQLSTGQGGKAFGSITTIDIAKAITEANPKLEIDRHAILLDKPIKSTGRFDIEVKLNGDVTGTIRVNVQAEGEESAGA